MNITKRTPRIGRTAVGGLLLLAAAAPIAGAMGASALAVRHEFSGRATVTQTCQVQPFVQLVSLAPGDEVDGIIQLRSSTTEPAFICTADATNHMHGKFVTTGEKTHFVFSATDVPTTMMACVNDPASIEDVTYTVYPAPYAQTNAFPVGGARTLP